MVRILLLPFWKKKGFRIIEKNYRTVFGEIDIIAQDKGVLVFVEVKARSDVTFVIPLRQ